MKKEKTVDELLAEDWIYLNQVAMQLAPDNCVNSLAALLKKVRDEEKLKTEAWKESWFAAREATGKYGYQLWLWETGRVTECKK